MYEYVNFAEVLRREITYTASVACFRRLLLIAIVDAENQDTNENGAEDDTEKEVNGYDGWSSSNAAKVAAEMSVNQVRVAVRQETVVRLVQVIFFCH